MSTLQEQINAANGKRKSRLVGQDEIDIMNRLVAEHQDDESIRAIRVYSREGFVPNSYKYRAPISYLEAYRQADGSLKIGAYVTDAKRSRGNGSLITINGKAA